MGSNFVKICNKRDVVFKRDVFVSSKGMSQLFFSKFKISKPRDDRKTNDTPKFVYFQDL